MGAGEEGVGVEPLVTWLTTSGVPAAARRLGALLDAELSAAALEAWMTVAADDGVDEDEASPDRQSEAGDGVGVGLGVEGEGAASSTVEGPEDRDVVVVSPFRVLLGPLVGILGGGGRRGDGTAPGSVTIMSSYGDSVRALAVVSWRGGGEGLAPGVGSPGADPASSAGSLRGMITSSGLASRTATCSSARLSTKTPLIYITGYTT